MGGHSKRISSHSPLASAVRTGASQHPRSSSRSPEWSRLIPLCDPEGQAPAPAPPRASPWPLTAVLTQRKPISRRHQQRGWGPRGEVCRHGKAREGAPVWALGSITTNKAGGGDGIPVELFQILKDDAVKVLHSVCCAYCAYVLRLCLSGIRSVSSASLCLCSFPFWTLSPQSGGKQGAHKPLDRTRWKRAGGPLAEYF